MYVLAGIITSLEPLAGFDWPEGSFCGLQRGWHRNGGGTGSQSEATEASGQGEADVLGSPRKAGCVLRPSPRDPGVLSLQQQVPPGCCSPGRYPSSLPDPSNIQSPDALPQVGTSSTSSSQAPSWELTNLRTWAGLGLAELSLTLAQGLDFPSKSTGLAGLQRDN